MHSVYSLSVKLEVLTNNLHNIIKSHNCTRESEDDKDIQIYENLKYLKHIIVKFIIRTFKKNKFY